MMNPLELGFIVQKSVMDNLLMRIPLTLMESWAICDAAGLTKEVAVGKAMAKYEAVFGQTPKLIYERDDSSTDAAVPIWVAVYQLSSSTYRPDVDVDFFCVVYMADPDESGRIAEEGFQATVE